MRNVNSRDEVDAVLTQAARRSAGGQAGVTDLLGGWAGYFLDPDEHLWEVGWNPRRPAPD